MQSLTCCCFCVSVTLTDEISTVLQFYKFHLWTSIRLLESCSKAMDWQHPNLMLLTPLLKGSDVPIKVGLLLAQLRTREQFWPDALPAANNDSWIPAGDEPELTEHKSVRHLNHWATAALYALATQKMRFQSSARVHSTKQVCISAEYRWWENILIHSQQSSKRLY